MDAKAYDDVDGDLQVLAIEVDIHAEGPPVGRLPPMAPQPTDLARKAARNGVDDTRTAQRRTPDNGRQRRCRQEQPSIGRDDLPQGAPRRGGCCAPRRPRGGVPVLPGFRPLPRLPAAPRGPLHGTANLLQPPRPRGARRPRTAGAIVCVATTWPPTDRHAARGMTGSDLPAPGALAARTGGVLPYRGGLVAGSSAPSREGIHSVTALRDLRQGAGDWSRRQPLQHQESTPL